MPDTPEEQVLRTIAAHGDPYHDEEYMTTLTKELMKKSIYLFQWFMMGINENDSVIQTVRWFLPHEGNTLDVGSGTGYTALSLSTIVPGMKFTLMNVSEFQLGLTYDKFPCLKWDAKSTPYPFDDAHFKNIIASYSLGHVGRLDAFLQECSRLLDKDGLLFIWDMVSDAPLKVAESLHYVVYSTQRVVNEAARVGLRPIRCGTPFPVSFQDKAMSFDTFNSLYKCRPVVYLFGKV
jgi:SAM-dependent methyltransferase